MAKGQPQDQVLSTKNLLFSSWDPEYMKQMACGKNLSDPGEEKRGPSASPHTYHFYSLEGSESWSPSGGNTTGSWGGGKEAPVSLDPAAGSPHPPPASSTVTT